jgi:hypothetical protein
VLTALSCLSALVAGYGAIAVEQAVRGAAGSLAGVGWRGLAVAPPFYLPRAVLDGAPATPLSWLGVALGGPLVLAAGGVLLYAALSLFRASGWLRSLVLSLAVLGVFWLPTELVAGALPGGGGPIAELYASLGNPPAGRWGTAALGSLLLWWLAGYAARRAVATGRSWMRADGVEFRRRLIRVVAGYPAALALAGAAAAQGWMPVGVAAVWGLMVLGMLMIRTA